MKMIFIVLTIQAIMGAIDNLWIHEIKERLPSTPSARKEVFLHAVREFSYAILFLTIGWWAWHGIWAWVLGALLLAEVGITIWDFLIEDKTRKLSPAERILHTLLTISFGVFLTLFFPILANWAAYPDGFTAVSYGIYSWLMTAFGVGVLAWGIRNLLAVMKLTILKVPEWQRRPIKKGEAKIKRRILITGATGFIGSHLTRMFIARGHAVWIFTRDRNKAIYKFGPHIQAFEKLEDIPGFIKFDSIINLAGAPIVGPLWTLKRKKILMQSRIRTTLGILNLIRRLENKPDVLINASAIGYYHGRDELGLDENSDFGEDFPARLCRRWEGMALAAKKEGVRVITLRIGLVLGREDGFLPPFLASARFGLGAKLGNGRQWLSWIHIQDLVNLILHCLHNEDFHGPVNATAPEPVMQKDFIKALADSVKRPQWLRVPKNPLSLILGEMATLFFDGKHVLPAKAINSGFQFAYPEVAAALEDLSGGQEPDNITPYSSAVFYNRECPICRAEIDIYKRNAQRSHLNLVFNDINEVPEALAAYGLAKDDIKRRLYVVSPNGTLKGGADAFIEIWRDMPRWHWGAKILRIPIFYFIGSFIYDGLMVPVLWRCNARKRKESDGKKSTKKNPGKLFDHAVRRGM